MATFVQPNTPLRHEGAERVEMIAGAVANAVGKVKVNFKSARSIGMTLQIATILLSAVVSGLLFASDKLVNDWSNGSMVWAWVTLWFSVTLVLTLLVRPVRSLAKWLKIDVSTAIATSYAKWQAHRATVRSDEAMWAYAQQDPRLMAEIQARLGGR